MVFGRNTGYLFGVYMNKNWLIILTILLLSINAFALTTTTFTSNQIPNTTDQNIFLSCSGGANGCKAINYKIDSGGLNIYQILSNQYLTAWYKLDETSGTNAADYKGWDNNGTNTGAVPVGSTGKIIKAYGDFPSNGYIDLGSNTTAGSEVKFGTLKAFSVCAWVNQTSTTAATNTIISQSSTTDSTYVWYLTIDAANRPLFVLINRGVVAYTATAATTITNGVWYHVCGTYDGTANANGIKVYLNGVKGTDATYASGALTIGNQNTAIGNYIFNAATYNFLGKIDEVGIWNKDLNQTYINQLYNGGSGTTYPYATNQLYTTYSGGGAHTIQYYSTDGADANESPNNGNFTTYGRIIFNFYDQNSLISLTSVLTTSTQGDSNTSIGNQFVKYLTGTTAQNVIYAFTKSNYGTRYYQLDQNQYSDLNILFALAPSILASDVSFLLYAPDQLTTLAGTYITLIDTDQNITIGQKQTDSTGTTIFNTLNTDQNMSEIINFGQYTYIPVQLTIKRPYDEQNTTNIITPYNISISQNYYANFTNLSADKVVALLPNTSLPFNIQIRDYNQLYTERTYAKQYFGNPLADVLQPYLILTTKGTITTFHAVSGYTNQPIKNITIKIYKFIEGVGRTYVEQIITDSKGEALSTLVAADTYEIEIYSGSTKLRTDVIIPTASGQIYVKIGDLVQNTPIYQQRNTNIVFYPSYGALGVSDVNLAQTVTFSDANSVQTINRVTFEVWNIDQNNITGNNVLLTSNSKAYALSLTNYWTIDTNKLNGVAYSNDGYIMVKVILETSDGNIYQTYTYKPYTGFSWSNSFGNGARSFFGCTAYTDQYGNPNPLIPCPTMLFLALIICILLTIAMATNTGFTSMTSMTGIFILGMGFFTYLTWVPAVLYGIMVAGTFVIYIIKSRWVS